MTKPTVHLNGTSRESLMAGYEAAYRALGPALDALGQTAPNARDYYVQGPDAFRAAVAEHSARYQRVRDVQGDILELFQSVDGINEGFHACRAGDCICPKAGRDG